MKILIIADRPLNSSQNLNFNLFLEKIENDFDSLVILGNGEKKDEIIKKGIRKKIFFKNFKSQDALNLFKSILISFNPDTLYILNFENMHQYIEISREIKKKLRIIVDIKTPCLIDKNYETIKSNLNKVTNSVDFFLSLSLKSLNSWFSNIKDKNKITIYPLSVPEKKIIPKINTNKILRLIYIGNLSKNRRLKNLIVNMQRLRETNTKFTLSIFGTGSDFINLKNETKNLNLSEFVKFHGHIKYNSLQKILHKFDIGINWIDDKNYSNSPTLKFLEYLQSGLKVVSSKNSVNENYFQKGMDFLEFDNDERDLSEKILEINKLKINNIRNHKIINDSFSFNKIYKEYLLPKIYKKITPIKSNKLGRVKYKILLFSEHLNSISGGAEKICIELANDLALDDRFQIYLGYIAKKRNYIERKLNNNVIQLPFKDKSEIDFILSKENFNIFFMFYYDIKVIKYLKLAKKNNVMFGVQECSNPNRVINKISENLFFYQNFLNLREIILNHCNLIRFTMKSYRLSVPDVIKKFSVSFPNPCYKISKTKKVLNNNKTKYIIHVNGFKSYNKNLITLLKAFNILRKDFPDWKLKIISKGITDEGSDFKKKLNEFINESNLKDQILLMGPKKDLIDEFLSSDIHAITSFEEGCPNVVLEAMSTGVPSIGFIDCPGTNELINQDIGILCERNISVFVKELRKLMKNDELRKIKSSNSLKLASSDSFDKRNSVLLWKNSFINALNIKTYNQLSLKKNAINKKESFLLSLKSFFYKI